MSYVPVGSVITADDRRAAGSAERPPEPHARPRLLTFVVDDLNLSFESTIRLKGVLRKLLDDLSPGDEVAIVRTGGGVGTMQQFTSDRRRILASVDRVRFNPMGVARLTATEPIDTEMPFTAGPGGGNPSGRDRKEAQRVTFEQAKPRIMAEQRQQFINNQKEAYIDQIKVEAYKAIDAQKVESMVIRVDQGQIDRLSREAVQRQQEAQLDRADFQRRAPVGEVPDHPFELGARRHGPGCIARPARRSEARASRTQGHARYIHAK